MKNKKQLSLMALGVFALSATAQEPIIQTKYTADPAPMVYNDTIFLYTSHDEDDAQGYEFKMLDWQLYTSTDMVNWTDHGPVASLKEFAWRKRDNGAWAQQVVERNGKFYMYCPLHGNGIGVLVSDSPYGPFKDPIGKPLVWQQEHWEDIDPTVWIDDDGQAYLFWGNNGLWYAKLNDDMISLGSEIMPVKGLEDPEAFGPLVMKMDYQLGKEKLKTGYEEGPWVTKRNGLYYLVYAAGGVPEHLAYSTSRSINGPWKYEGRIMDEAENSFTIHAGSIEFKGRNFMFYHNGTAVNGGGFRRSTAIEEFSYTADGKIPFIPFTREGVRTPVSHLNPYERVEAETMADSYGLKTDRRTGGNHHYVTSIHNGDWMRLRSVDFGKEGAKRLLASVMKVQDTGATIEFHAAGQILAVVPVCRAGELTVEIQQQLTGVHDLFILFRGGDGELFDFDWWQVE